MTVISVNCVGGAGGNDPTPASLLVIANVSFGLCTTPIADLGTDSGQIPWGTPTVPVGRYFVNYISGNIPFANPTLNSQGRATGNSGGFNEVGSVITFASLTLPASVPGDLVGFICGHSPPADCSPPEIAVIVANTIAANPVAGPLLVDSTTFGTGGGNVAGAFGRSTIVETVLGAFCAGGGSITWELIQTQHIYDQPSCIQIKDYAAVKAQLGTCAVCTDPVTWCTAHPAFCGGPTSEWDGTFPVRRVFFPAADDYRVNFYADPNVDNAQINFLSFTLNGKAIATAFPNVFTGISYRLVAGVAYWELRIICYLDPASGFVQAMWVGKKMTGTDPIGEYTLDATSDSCSPAPSTICIEACP